MTMLDQAPDLRGGDDARASAAGSTPLTADAPFIAAPRIGRGTFVGVLRAVGSPWAVIGGELHDLIRSAGHDPGVWLAIAAVEHSYGTAEQSVLRRNDTRSWTNARSVRDPQVRGWSLITDAVRGSTYVRYASVADSLRDGMYRISDPTYRYQREGRTTLGAVFAIWTEGDGAAYTNRVLALLRGWQAAEARAPYAALFGDLTLHDLRSSLPQRRSPTPAAGPFERVPLADKRGLVLHYSGPAVADRGDTVAVLQREAAYHVGKNWASAGQPVLYGDGLMYHLAIGDDGRVFLCRDLEAVLWHCGAWPQNALALAVHLPLGAAQRATAAQLAALATVATRWCDATGTPLSAVQGHQELQPTACPGTLMADFIHPYRRNELAPRNEAQFFPETGCVVGGGFWQFWQARGGLPIFGFPLSNELLEGGRVVQYFERAVMEWHPEHAAPWDILLRRLGADALARRALADAAADANDAGVDDVTLGTAVAAVQRPQDDEVIAWRGLTPQAEGPQAQAQDGVRP